MTHRREREREKEREKERKREREREIERKRESDGMLHFPYMIAHARRNFSLTL